ncbi:MAG: neutral zinc metallopeptidase [Elusimicrobiota bacterium]|nr:neutral zinc metallopeptidase [Elusimicrobiota bacterium]
MSLALRRLAALVTTLCCVVSADAGMAPVRAARPAGRAPAGISAPAGLVAPSFAATLTQTPVVAPVNLVIERAASAIAQEPSRGAPRVLPVMAPPLPAPLPLPRSTPAPGRSPSEEALPEGVDAAPPQAGPTVAPDAGAGTAAWRARAAAVAARIEEGRRHFGTRAAAAIFGRSPRGPRATPPSRPGPPRSLTMVEKARFGFPRDRPLIGTFSDGDREVTIETDGRAEVRRFEGRLILRVSRDASGSAPTREVSLDGGATWQPVRHDRKKDVMKLTKPTRLFFGSVRGRAPRAIVTQARQMWGALEDFWASHYPALAEPRNASVLVLFEKRILTPTGWASGVGGPIYHPANKKTYLPQEFYDMLVERFGGDGGYARLHMLAHEYGHHVQVFTGIHGYLEAARPQLSETEKKRLEVILELHADALSGYFAAHAARVGIVEPGDLEVAAEVTASIGDDTLRREMNLPVRPDDFTHGSTAQRREWFLRGLHARSLRELDPFSDPALTRGLPPSALTMLAQASLIVARMPLPRGGGASIAGLSRQDDEAP